MQKFEYKVLEVVPKGWWKRHIDYQELTDKLNELGREGWEVATFTHLNFYEGARSNCTLILKRPINDN